MSLSIASNTSAATAHRYLSTNSTDASQSLAKLSSGSRVVRASDDAASLAVGTKLKADVASLKQAQVNASNGSSVLQVADGAMQQVSDVLIRMKTLATQAQAGSISNTERGYLNQEFSQLISQVDSIANDTKFNGSALFGGSYAQDFLVGLDGDSVTTTTNDVISVSLNGFTAATTGSFGMTTSDTISTATGAQASLTKIDTAINNVLTERAKIGGLMSRFDYTSANLSTQIENMDAARSSLLDVDVAAEMSNFSSKQVLMQASVSMLAQANQMPQNLMRLLQ